MVNKEENKKQVLLTSEWEVTERKGIVSIVKIKGTYKKMNLLKAKFDKAYTVKDDRKKKEQNQKDQDKK